MKRGKGFAASKAQRDKVRGEACVFCRQNAGFDIGDGGGVFVVDPAHLWPRGMGGCDEPDCVIPLCRAHHRRFDDPSDSFDLLPSLIDRGYHAEIAHAISAHEVPLTQLLERLTGERWIPALESPKQTQEAA